MTNPKVPLGDIAFETKNKFCTDSRANIGMIRQPIGKMAKDSMESIWYFDNKSIWIDSSIIKIEFKLFTRKEDK
jgi:hypothetical protein